MANVKQALCPQHVAGSVPILTVSISGCPGTVTLGVTEIPARREKITFNGLKITSQDFNSMYEK